MNIQPICAEDTIELRHALLRAHQPRSACHYDGDNHPQAGHFGAFDTHGQHVGIVSIYAENHPEHVETQGWRIRAMATSPVVRHQGVGRQLLHAAEIHAQTHGDEDGVIWANARVSALPFYQKLGYQTVGERFDLPGIGAHFVIVKTLK